MNLLEYVQTLSSDISIAEKIALTKAWKDKNEDPIEQEVIETSVEEVKPSKFNEDGSFNLSSFENEDSKNLAKSTNEKKKKAAADENAFVTASQEYQAFQEKYLNVKLEGVALKLDFQETVKKNKEFSDLILSQNFNQMTGEAPTYVLPEEYSKISKSGEIYSPGDGWDYKFNFNNENGQIEYLTKRKESKNFLTPSDQVVSANVANIFGHLSKKQQKQLEEVNASNRAIAKRQKQRAADLLAAKEAEKNAIPLIQEGVEENVEVGLSFSKKTNYLINQLILNSEESTLKLKGRNTRAYRNKVEGYIKSGMKPEEAEAKATSESSVVEASYDVTTDSVEDIINNLKVTDQEKEDIRLAIKLTKEISKAAGKVQIDARMRKASPFSPVPTTDKTLKKYDYKNLSNKLDALNKKYLGKTTKQVATPEAVEGFTNTFNTLQGNYGKGDSAKSNEVVFNQTINNFVKNDPFIKAELLKLQINADQDIKDFSIELQKKYDTSTVDGNKKATEELQQFAKSLTQDKLLNGDVFKNRFSQIQTVGLQALQEINIKDTEINLLQARMKDSTFAILEAARKTPLLPASLFIEGLMKGSKRFQNAVNVVQKDFAADGARESINMLSSLEKALESGEVDLTTRLSFNKGGSMTVEKALDYFKKAKTYDEKNIIEQLDDLSDISKDLGLYREINPEDSWLTRTFQTVAESVPMMGAAVGGGIVNYLTGGAASAALVPIVSTLGTTVLFTQFYGDAWEDTFMEGATSEAKSKGIDLDNISKEEKRDFLLQALQSGKYDKSANASATAAFQAATEKFGFSKQMSAASKALGLGKEGITSLVQGQWKQTGKAFFQGSLAKLESAASEGVTEWWQTIAGDLNKGFAYGKGTDFVNFDSAWEAAKAGSSAGLLMPGGASIVAQTRVEIQNLSRKIAIEFAPDSNFGKASLVADNYFKAAQTELNQRLDLGVNPDGTEYTIQQHQDDTNALASTSNAYRRIPSTASTELRTELLDLMVRRDKLQLEINKIDDSDLTALQQLELNLVKDEIKEVAKEASAPVGVKTDVNAVKKGAGVAISQLGAGVERVSNTKDLLSSILSLEAQGVKVNINRNEKGEILPAKDQDYGIFAKVPDGKGGFDIQLIINDVSAKADGLLPADKHELLHVAAMKMDDASKIKMGSDILNSLINDSNIQVDRKTRRLLAAYKTDLDKGDITAADFFEEVMAVTSDGLTPDPKTGVSSIRVKDISKFKAIAQKILQTIGWRQNFADGQQAIDFLKEFNADVLKGEGLSESVLSKFDTKTDTDVETKVESSDSKASKKDTGAKPAQTNPAEVAAGYQVTPLAAFFVEDIETGEKTNESLIVDAAPKNNATPENRIAAQDALLEANWPVISNSIKFDPTGKVPQPFIKLAVQEMFRDIFPGRGVKAKFFDKFDPTLKTKATTFIDSQLKDRMPEILERAKLIQSEKQDAPLEKAGGVIDTSTTPQPTNNSKLAKPPSETVRYKDEAVKNLKLTPEKGQSNKDAIEAKISEVITKAYKGKDITRFKQTANIPKAVAKLYADMFGITTASGIKALSVKAQNVPKGDAGGITRARQFLIENAAADFARIPRTKDDFEKAGRVGGTGVYQTKLGKALYNKNGKLTGSLKNYIDIVSGKNVTVNDIEFNALVKGKKLPIYRDAQHIKAALDFHIRNRAIETLQPAQGERIKGGAKFSKKINNKLSLEEVISEDALFKLNKLSTLRDKNALGKALGFKTKTINEETRAGLVADMLDAFKNKKYNLSLMVLEAAKAESGGIKSFYGNITKGKFVPNKNGKKYIKTTDGKYILASRKKSSKITNWVPRTGKLFYGLTDPNYQDIVKVARKYEGPKFQKISIPRGKKQNEVLDEEWKKDQKQKEKNNKIVRRDFVNELAEAHKNGLSLDIIGSLVIQSYQATSGLIKVSAPFDYASAVLGYGVGLKQGSLGGVNTYREEHNPPASVAGASIMWAIKYNKLEPEGNIVKLTNDALDNNYYQTQLAKFDDQKLDQAKLEATLPEGFTIFDNPIVRFAAAGIDLNTIINISTGKTIAETFNAGIPAVIYDAYNANEKLEASAYQNEQVIKAIKDPNYSPKKNIKVFQKLVKGKAMASKLNSGLITDAIKYDKPITVQTAINALEKTDKALNNARKLDAPVKKIRVFDFDDTLAKSKSMVIVNMPDGSTNQINATQFAQQASDLESQGAEFDFSEFSKVVDGKKGPLFKVAKKIADVRGTEDVFILTARPQNADGPIRAFMKANGVDIPLKNITGLGDGTAQAKAGWIMGKAAEGYNDFYFADDAVKNVKAVKDVLSQVDVKSKVQLAKASKKITFDTIVNDLIKDSSGIETYKQYSAARAKTVGANKGRFNFFIPPSAEDFTGLLYKMLGKGKKGDAQMAFLKANLLDPYDRAESAVTQAKIAAANDFKALKQNLKTLPKSLSKPTGIGGFTFSHAVRVAIWSKQGMDIPGLSKKDIKELNDFVNSNTELSVFTDELMKIQKSKPYPKPGDNWLGGNITSDIINDINKVNRAEYQQEWRENVDIIFSEDNMNKMEAAYGTKWRRAMEDSLRRMKSGSNRPPGGNSVTDGLLDWLNNSVGAVMFLNTRSALLQTISAVNFINWGDNNIVKAGLAFANQKQFWSDFMTLMNSDYLVERRNGLKINVSESEIADAVRDSDNKVKAAIAFLLSKGFVMTRFADSFAIATGGSTFYRNRVKALVGKGMEQKAAEAQAFEDFRQIAEESQQSSNPNRISQQQASGAGRVILAWANTPMQYARIQKRAAQDLINGRGDWKTNVSKIVYYGAVQNLIFNALQQAVFALGFGEDEDEEVKDAKKNEKISRVANGMIDSQLKGLGIGGAAVVAVKSALMELGKQHAKDRPKYEEAVFDLLGFSPPLGSKIQKIYGGLRSFSWNMKDMKEKGLSLDNPAYLAGAQIITGLTNLPLDRVIKKLNSMRGILSEQSARWQKVALGLGWSTWDVGLGYYGGFDAAKVLTPEEEKVKEIDDMKKLTKTKEQVDMLLDLGLTKKEIKDLGKEQSRVEKIIELQNAEAKPKEEAKVKEEIKEETKPEPKVKAKPKTESAEKRLKRQFDSIKDENKPDQVKTLLKFGLTKKQIRTLQYEENRVNKILELMEKNK